MDQCDQGNNPVALSVRTCGLGSSNESENQYDNKNESYTSAWVVSPSRTVRPGGKHAEQEYDEDYGEYEVHTSNSTWAHPEGVGRYPMPFIRFSLSVWESSDEQLVSKNERENWYGK